MKPKIVFLDEYSLAGRDLSAVKALGDYTGYDMTAPDEVAVRCADAEIVVTNKVRLDAAMIAQLPHLRLICVAATGVNNIDLDAAAEHGVEVRNAAGYSTHSVAETTLGAAIALLRETYGSKIKVFATEIPHSVRAKEISAEGKSIFAHDPGGKVAESYKNLTQEVTKLEKQREKSRAGIGR